MHSRRNYAKGLYHTGVKIFQVLFVLVFTFSLLGVQPVKPVQAAPDASVQANGTETTFAVVTDYGYASNTTVASVANMVNGWNPDFIVTAGDNNQGNTCGTACYQGVVGAYFGPEAVSAGRIDYIGRGDFWPVIGNHDTYSPTTSYQSYFNYLPGSSGGLAPLYYDFVEGPVHFFMLDSAARECQ